MAFLEDYLSKRAFLLNPLAGALYGALRHKDQGETRLGAIGRSSLTGLAAGVGTIAGGAALGTLGWELSENSPHRASIIIAAALAGGALGGLAGYHAAARPEGSAGLFTDAELK